MALDGSAVRIQRAVRAAWRHRAAAAAAAAAAVLNRAASPQASHVTPPAGGQAGGFFGGGSASCGKSKYFTASEVESKLTSTKLFAFF